MRKLFTFVLMSLISLMSTVIYAQDAHGFLAVVGSTNLTGTEEAWQYAEKNEMSQVSDPEWSITYANLPKGHYEFLVVKGEIDSYYGEININNWYRNVSSDCSDEGWYYFTNEWGDNNVIFELKETSDVTIKLRYESEICLTSTKGFAKSVETSINGVKYVLREGAGSATVIGLVEEEHPLDLVIPETVTYDGSTFTVTEIGNRAFAYSTLNSITLPATITAVGAQINIGSSCKVITFLSETVPAFFMEYEGNENASLFRHEYYDSDLGEYVNYPTIKVPCGAIAEYGYYMVWELGQSLPLFEKDAYMLSVYSNEQYRGSVEITQRNTCENNTAVIEASTSEGSDYRFYSWSDGNTDNPRIVTLTSDSTFIAIFKEIVKITVKSADETQGTVAGNIEVFDEDSVTITATPAEGYEFDYWTYGSDGYKIQENPYTFEAYRDETYIAYFCKAKVMIDGLNYYLDDEKKTARVANGDYKGEIIIPATVTYNGVTYTVNEIREDAFKGNKNITAITIPETFNTNSFNEDETHYIPEGFIDGCTNLTTIAGTSSAIGSVIYEGYNHTIKQAIVFNDFGEDGEPWWWANIVLYFAALESLDLSAVEVELIDYLHNSYDNTMAFEGAHNLKTLILPKTLTNIPAELCREAWSLQSITIPKGVTEIGDAAFYNCHALSSVNFEGTPKRIGKYAFYNAHALTSISIPNGVEEVGAAAFYGCTYLTDIEIPASVKVMGDNSFALCSKVKSIKSAALVPPTIEDKTFYEVDLNTPLYVYESAYEAYKADRYWGRFNNIIKVDNMPTDVENTDASSVVIYTQGGLLYVEGVETDYNVFDSTGNLIYTGRDAQLSLPRGVYMITVGGEVQKVVI